jgi:fumarate hydratase class I
MLLRNLDASLLELVRRTSAELPEDIKRVINQSLQREKKGSVAWNTFSIIEKNIQLAKERSLPICQDTGSCLFYVDCPVGLDQIAFAEVARAAVKEATLKGYLRQNSVDSLTGKIAVPILDRDLLFFTFTSTHHPNLKFV